MSQIGIWDNEQLKVEEEEKEGEGKEERGSSAGRGLAMGRHRLLFSLFPAPFSGAMRIS